MFHPIILDFVENFLKSRSCSNAKHDAGCINSYLKSPCELHEFNKLFIFHLYFDGYKNVVVSHGTETVNFYFRYVYSQNG